MCRIESAPRVLFCTRFDDKEVGTIGTKTSLSRLEKLRGLRVGGSVGGSVVTRITYGYIRCEGSSFTAEKANRLEECSLRTYAVPNTPRREKPNLVFLPFKTVFQECRVFCAVAVAVRHLAQRDSTRSVREHLDEKYCLARKSHLSDTFH